MSSIEIEIRHQVGLHARPAALFVQAAQKYKSTVTLGFGDKSANAKSLLGILGLGIGSGAKVTITANGEDEQLAVEALKKLVETNFGE